MERGVDLFAILQKSLDRALFSYIFTQDFRSSGARASIAIVHIRKFFKVYHNNVRFRFFLRSAKRSVLDSHSRLLAAISLIVESSRCVILPDKIV